ncbi:hypothetical protein SM124_14770 [Bacillus sp. 31A1R]|uniref:Membrane protein YczE n=1 Tax=Robertmurraya mangrovi TaxID=3098077 RepID=A0ABU5J0N8_9BACI|nr:hypothetical protein [Bacillus sp. 31A1R]MDZ5472978.1 hypothetical protein [Bacillus sp. 31A1R]
MKIRIAYFTIGLLILTLGVALIIKAGLGASSWDALAVGESNTFHLSVGTFVFINGIILMFINAFLLKKRPEILAAGTIFVIGLLIDFWLVIILNAFNPKAIFIQAITLVIGIFVLAIGVAIYLQAKFPASPMDTLMIAISKRFHLSLRISRIISEGLALILAFLFKGAIGVGTIIVTLTLGPIVQYFYTYFNRRFTEGKSLELNPR